jgi:arylsulfatase A-like enzyme
VTSSLCAPSRAAYLTGRYNHFNGIASNFHPFPLDNVTHASLLRQVGYTTAYIGKWHMDSQRERPGFDFHASFIGHGRYFDCPLLVQGVETPTTGWVDDVTTGYAIDFMEKQKASGKPWSMAIGFKAPHGPFTPPERAKKRFEGEQARTVPNLDVQAVYMEKMGFPFKKPGTQDGLVPANLDHFRCVSACDENLGRLLDALDQLGYAENTVVIYTSDNGFYFGEHGLGDKRSAYDESLRVPFLVRFPKLGETARGKLIDEPILNIDLAPTLLDFAGVTIPETMQGKSWKPFLEGKKPENWRNVWFYEYFAEKQQNSKVVDITAIRSLNAKLIKYAVKDKNLDDWTELFDLDKDPYELKNLYNDPAYAELRRNMESEYGKLLKESGYRIPDYVDRPDWWDKGLPTEDDSGVFRVTQPELRLMLDFTKDEKNTIRDSSGKGNDGTNRGTVIEQGQNNQPARRFDGKSIITLKKTPSLDPAKLPWTTEIVFKSDNPNGLLIAVGGESHGYSLLLEEGKPVFRITVAGDTQRLVSRKTVDGWCTLTAIFTTDKKMLLFMDGQLVGERNVPSLISTTPNHTFRIGADSYAPPIAPGFTGVMDSVKLYAGEVFPTPK